MASSMVAEDAEGHSPRSVQQTNTTHNPDLRWYTFDEDKLAELRSQCPWQKDPKYFKKVVVSPSAIMKMMMHCHSGVEKGIKKGGNPVEVMGLCMGRPDTQDTTILIVTDVFPLPIEGFETRVIADDQNVVNYMIQLQESSEKMRKEKFMGWYHSHPFDVGKYSNCFLSSTDLSTQLQWQRSEDGHGNPFLAMVIDPLRSLAKNTPVLEAFRAYPPEYNSPIPNECPDGTIVLDESARLERWGSCWQRYYTLSVEYFMSQQSRRIMESLTKNFLWIRTLGSTPVLLEGEYVEQYPERVHALAEKVRVVSSSAAPERRRIAADKEKESNELDNICQGIAELANEKIHGNIAQVAKKSLFCDCSTQFSNIFNIINK